MKAGSRFYLAIHLVWLIRVFALKETDWLSLVVYFITLALFVVLGYTDSD